MKKLTAVNLEDTPLSRKRGLRMAYKSAYVVALTDAKDLTAKYAGEVERFIRLRDGGGCDKVAEVTRQYEEVAAFLKYMEDNGLDIVVIEI